MAEREGKLEADAGSAIGQRLGDRAYTRILETLFERKIPAGAFLSQGDLVKMLQIPVAPLRDALKLLEAEGIVVIHSRSGIQFVKPGFELTRSTYQFRSIIERAATGVYAQTAEEAELEELERRHLSVIEDIERNGLTDHARAGLEQLETLLHHSIIASLNNPLIDSSYKRLHNYVRLIRLDRKVTVSLVLQSLREHMQVILACKARDPEAAAAAMQAHLASALQRGLGLYYGY
ncbi:MAG: GntR family transcriptional regulator [Mesorhizobium sp.]|nr:GntR family transcriptional regulator [bacterium M00.F.Ca.ET.205.01.1.1]TGU49519.1 GntR family transcriptional regulator [bacterium M00.F.Ca.ET.152.01.1.1]TGV33618.1 GntR family transcriptional regulator [Mesorhizobium sp. M00.F.Ca.ET.186.01.1.1]TGZ40520.1 GntR family transcriptional regulator [bacterium M00.F.Ca.ET.162.01.1.1]TJW31715.1 MAG: GntR family transcriptional regulator [Mesorhizobium sp.]